MYYADVLRYLASNEVIPREEMRSWIASEDLLTWSAVYALIAQLPATPLPTEEAAEFMRRYLLRCIEENPTPGDYVHGGYEAAWELATTLKAWRRRGGGLAKLVRPIALDLANLYRRGDAATKNRVLCGVLEHAFEDVRLRKYFSSWERDTELREAYNLAVEWGAAHEE